MTILVSSYVFLCDSFEESEMGTDLESKHGGKRPNWIPDAWAPACHKCKKGITQIRRKHHCRACGNVFCNSKINIAFLMFIFSKACSANKLALPSFMYFDPVRVCDKCFGSLEGKNRILSISHINRRRRSCRVALEIFLYFYHIVQ